MKYFRLHFFVRYVSGDNGGCLYDTQTGKMIYVEKENNAILEQAEENMEVDENTPFLRELYDRNMGMFYDTGVFVEATRMGVSKEYEYIAPPKIVVNHAFVQVTNDCTGECVFCETGDKVYTKTHCKKWRNTEVKEIDWKSICKELQEVQCKRISFIGGDPLAAFDKVKTIVETAQEEGITEFELYTNLCWLSEEQMEYISENRISVNVQIIELKEVSAYTGICGSNVEKNIQALLQRNVNVEASVLITKYNEDDIEEITKRLRSLGICRIKADFYYENEDNQHYSEKFKTEMYQRQFLSVNKATLSFMEKYNNCFYGKVSINLAGDVTPCPMMNTCKLGNVLRERLHTILGKQEYQEIIRMTRSKTGNCKSCAFRLNCVDCRALESSATGKVDGVKYCEYV